MRSVSNLRKPECVQIILRIRDHLYLTTNEAGQAVYDPDKEWDATTLSLIAEVFNDYGLAPTKKGDEPQ